MTDIIDELERLRRDFYRQNQRMPTLLVLPESYADSYAYALGQIRTYMSDHTPMWDIRRDETRHGDCLVVLSRFVRTPVFAWTPERVGP